MVLDRHKSWRLLDSMQGMTSGRGCAYEILQACEQEGGNIHKERQMEGFRQCVKRCRFTDMGYSGNLFTSFTTRGGGIKVRLDRALGTQAWIDMFLRFLSVSSQYVALESCADFNQLK